MEAHISLEFLVGPTLIDVASCIIDETSAEAVESIFLSYCTVTRRIVDIAEDIEYELISQLKARDAYALQMDESTDMARLAITLVSARYGFKEENNLHLCKSVELHATGKYIFLCVDNYIKKYGTAWDRCISVCTVGANDMIGKLSCTVTE